MNQKFEYILRLGDNSLILGHRISEWCGHGPILEQDIAFINIALDLVGQARLWLSYAAEVEDKGRDEDLIAYRRDAFEFRNLKLVEIPNGHWGNSIARQFLFDTFHHHYLEALAHSKDHRIAEIAQKSIKETAYHKRFSSEWMIRLGDGTEESHEKMQTAINDIWPYVGEMFLADDIDQWAFENGIGPDLNEIKKLWEKDVNAVLAEATLSKPNIDWMQKGGKQGSHTEHLGFILAEMQYLQRAYPDAKW